MGKNEGKWGIGWEVAPRERGDLRGWEGVGMELGMGQGWGLWEWGEDGNEDFGNGGWG